MTCLYRLLPSIAFWFSLFGMQDVAAQQLQGTYTFGNSVESTYITFTEGNRFNYLYSSCTDREKGCGIYTLIGNCLVLTFKDDGNVKSAGRIVADSSNVPGGGLNRQFSVADNDKVKTEEVQMYAGEEKATITTTDNEEGATFMMPVGNDAVSIPLSYLTPVSCDERLGNVNDIIKALLRQREANEVLKEGNTLRFYIRNIQRNRFEMRRAWRGAPFEIYRKTARRLED